MRKKKMFWLLLGAGAIISSCGKATATEKEQTIDFLRTNGKESGQSYIISETKNFHVDYYDHSQSSSLIYEKDSDSFLIVGEDYSTYSGRSYSSSHWEAHYLFKWGRYAQGLFSLIYEVRGDGHSNWSRGITVSFSSLTFTSEGKIATATPKLTSNDLNLYDSDIAAYIVIGEALENDAIAFASIKISGFTSLI